MAGYSTENRYLYLKSPLGDDLLLAGFTGRESISELFRFQLDLLAENSKTIAFDRLLGQKTGFGLEVGDAGKQKKRPFHGIVTRVVQLARGKEFTHYRMDVEPRVWLLTQTVRSRIFQHVSIPEILKKVLQGIDAAYEIRGTFHPREFCVQYQESDFAFASRLMEEEGIYYFFKFTEDGHTMVLANTSQSHPDVPEDSKLIFEEMEGGTRDESRISLWEKTQDLRSGKYTTWDHNFELPYKHLEAEQTVVDTVQAGKVTHKLKVGGNDKLEIFDYPGGYAARFDGIDKGGGDADSTLQKVFEDNKRTVGIRMQQVETPMLLVQGASNYRQMTPGYRFTLQRHFNADGQYVILSVDHEAIEGSFRAESSVGANHYGNSFKCLPFALPFRPGRKTSRPFIHGCQTAVVSGPAGEEIFTDKYGRVKVQFHWDREGKGEADSSCWIRVATTWAGKQWGAISIPRIGHEVIVDFIEGDPDRPIIVGSVYNADLMPSYTLPEHKTRSGVKSRSSIGGGGFNEVRFEDKKDSEQIFIHGQKDLDVRIENDRREWIGRDRHLVVKRDRYEEVTRDCHIKAGRDQMQEIARDSHQAIGGKAAYQVSGSYSMKVDGDVALQFGGKLSETVGGDISIKAGGKITLLAGAGLTIQGPGGHVTIDAAGVTIVGTMVKMNSGGAPLSGGAGSLVSPLGPGTALIADNSVPGGASFKTQLAAMSVAELASLAAASGPTHSPPSGDGKSEDKDKTDKTAWVEITLENPDGTPAAGAAYRIGLPDDSVASGSLDEKGFARVAGIDPGQVKITFPELDKEAWESK